MEFFFAIEENDFDEAINLFKKEKEFINENSLILLLNKIFHQSITNNDVENYFQNYLPQFISEVNYEILEEVISYQLKVYSKFISTIENFENIYFSSNNPNYQFSLLLPQIEQALLYGDKSNLLNMLNQINFGKIDSKFGKNKITKLISIKKKFNEKFNESIINSEIGNYIYREKIIPNCFLMPPNPIKVKRITNQCGYFVFNYEKDKFVFELKLYSNIGLVPINVFKESLEEIKGDKTKTSAKINLLKRMIYCLKSSQRRFYCIRNENIKKSEVIRWFNDVNKGKERQKYWYYDKIYYDINNWPFYNSEDKINKNRIWQ